MKPNAEIKVGLAGYYKMEVGRPGEPPRQTLDWFENGITDIGMDRVGQGNCLQYCSVGTDSTAFATSQTALLAWVATVGAPTTTTSVSGSSPYYGYTRQVYTFAVGAAAGNLNEVGVGWANTGSSSPLFSRARIVDGGGTPTTITVLSDEILVVTYELRIYAPAADVSGTVTISGTAYDFTLRAARVNSSSFPGWACFGTGGGSGVVHISATGFQNLYEASSTLGAVTSNPSGTTGAWTGISNASYTPGTYYRDATWQAGLTESNLTGGVGACTMQHYLGFYQCSFNPDFAKDSTKTLSLTFRFSWARH